MIVTIPLYTRRVSDMQIHRVFNGIFTQFAKERK